MIDKLRVDDLEVHTAETSMLTAVRGLGLPQPRREVFPRASRHGAIDHTEFHDGRVVEIEGICWGEGSTSAWDALDQLKARLALGAERTLVFRRRGRTFDERIAARVATPLDDELGPGFIRFAVSLFASDPRIYSDALKSGSYDPTAALTGGGVRFPLAFPLTFSTTTATHLELVNAGNFRTPPVLTIDGPVNNPFLDNDTTGETIAIAASLGSSDQVVVDVAKRTLTLNGAARLDLLAVAQTTWWELGSGTSRIRLRGTGMAAAKTRLTCQYRDARI